MRATNTRRALAALVSPCARFVNLWCARHERNCQTTLSHEAPSEVSVTARMGQGATLNLLKELGAGKATALPAVKLLHKLGLIETYENGKQGTVNPRATIYRRLR